MEVEHETPTSGPLQVGGDVLPPIKQEIPLPRCTRDARAAKVQGAVVLQMVVTEEGETREIKVLKSGLPMEMERAVIDSARGWRFGPATRNGEPVEVYYNLTVNISCQ
jgi:protein TonB